MMGDLVQEAFLKELEGCVRKLGKHYGFDVEEGMRVVMGRSEKVVVEKVEKKVAKKKMGKPSIPLPWMGKAVEGWCLGIRPHHGLLSQCTQEAKTNGFCPTCYKQVQSKGKPKCGTVKERMEADANGETYKNPETGKEAVTYGTVMKKFNIDRKTAEKEAAKFDFEIPESEFEVPTKTKGRPRKEAKKVSTSVGGSDGEDLLNSIVQNVTMSTDSSSSENESDDEERKSLLQKLKDHKHAPKFDEKKASVIALKEALKTADTNAEKEANERAKLIEKLQKFNSKPDFDANAPIADLMALVKSTKETEDALKKKVKEEKAAKKAGKKVEPQPVHNDEELEAEDPIYDAETDDDETEAVLLEHEGKKYYMDPNTNVVYDYETMEPIGTWDDTTKKITPLEEVGSDDETDDEPDDE